MVYLPEYAAAWTFSITFFRHHDISRKLKAILFVIFVDSTWKKKHVSISKYEDYVVGSILLKPNLYSICIFIRCQILWIFMASKLQSSLNSRHIRTNYGMKNTKKF